MRVHSSSSAFARLSDPEACFEIEVNSDVDIAASDMGNMFALTQEQVDTNPYDDEGALVLEFSDATVAKKVALKTSKADKKRVVVNLKQPNGEVKPENMDYWHYLTIVCFSGETPVVPKAATSLKLRVNLADGSDLYTFNLPASAAP